MALNTPTYYKLLASTALLLVASCSGAPDDAARSDIKPQDFALVPCGVSDQNRPCALAIAGGKRVLIGAPAGVGETLIAEDLRLLDAVILFSLRADDIEGLDEIRNNSWHAGRAEPLIVVGPEATNSMVAALNLTFEQSDALRVVEEGIPPGGYDAAVLDGRESMEADVPAFDTGDFRVFRQDDSIFLSYLGEHGVALDSCRLDRPSEWVERSEEIDLRIGCRNTEVAWPLDAIHFVLRNN